MLQFILKRILVSVLLFLLLTFVLYLIVQFLPSYAENDINKMVMQNGSITEQQKLDINTKYNLDKPVIPRYAAWIGSLFDGTWSHSFANLNTTVLSVIKTKIKATLILMSLGLAFAVLLSIPLGMRAAIRPGGAADGVTNALTFTGISIPNFILALLLIFLFSAKLGILPSMVVQTSRYPYLAQMLLPIVCVMISVIGPIVKQVRGSMLDVMNMEYVKTARAKGIPENQVVRRHVFRNAAIPVVTAIGLAVPMLVGGSVVIEQIFTINGIGRTLVNAVYAPADVPLIMGIVAIQVVVVLVVNLALDIIYTLLDPRIAYQ
ncbi:MAG: ABC transporter permease [Clostridiales Family XIII bacterium]|jgi:peptide/nickel transport system permease protein|nr:ABC transporter permease [Clostridiales Family XIII bacterium]